MWNVNALFHEIVGAVNKGINRNIVECKLPTAARQCIAIPELIETLWNVNEDKEYQDIKRSIGINRNIVECK